MSSTEKKDYVLHMPVTKSQFNFIVWTIMEVLLSFGVYYFSINYGGTGYVCVGDSYHGTTCGNWFDIFDSMALFVSTLLYLFNYGVIDWIAEHRPRFRIEWK